MFPAAPSRRTDFQVATICALSTEYNAVSLVFDQFWDDNGDTYGRATGDDNQYTTGRIGKHDVVLALLPRTGKVDAASAAARMRTSYTALKLALLVGVCGAVPHGPAGEILLGDVIISKSVVQHDFGRRYPDKFVRKDTVEDNFGPPNRDVRGLLVSFQTDRVMERLEQRTAAFLEELQTKAARRKRLAKDKYKYPGAERDMLFDPRYRHKHRASRVCVCRDCVEDTDPVCDDALTGTCDDLGCESIHVVARQRIDEKRQLERDGDTEAQNPALHVGAMASGDVVMKSAGHRDKLAMQESVIAFEMEGAGIWESVPCLVVKAVCDYADSHKHKQWQDFAAATAAAAAKAILERYIRTEDPYDSAGSRAGQDTERYGNGADVGRGEALRGGVNVKFGDYNRGSQLMFNHGTMNNTFGG